MILRVIAVRVSEFEKFNEMPAKPLRRRSLANAPT
jgi:hypothetical protein